MLPRSRSTLFPYTTLFRSDAGDPQARGRGRSGERRGGLADRRAGAHVRTADVDEQSINAHSEDRSEEHTSELQSHSDLVCRLLLEKKSVLLLGDKEPC